MLGTHTGGGAAFKLLKVESPFFRGLGKVGCPPRGDNGVASLRVVAIGRADAGPLRNALLAHEHKQRGSPQVAM